jgi:hypothetical protein
MATGSAADASSSRKLMQSSSLMDLEEIDEIPELVDLQTPKTAKTSNFLGFADPVKSLNSVSLKGRPKRKKEHFDSGDYFCEKEISMAIEGNSPKNNLHPQSGKMEPSAMAFKRWNSVQLGHNSTVSKEFEFDLGFADNQESIVTPESN